MMNLRGKKLWTHESFLKNWIFIFSYPLGNIIDYFNFFELKEKYLNLINWVHWKKFIPAQS